MTHRQYEGDGITVYWDSGRCIHSELCVFGAPAVFDHAARPWVSLDGASADGAASVIDTCPSGALSYSRTDGFPNGRRGRATDEDPAASTRSDTDGTTLATVTALPNGPLLVQGPIAIARADGAVDILERATLCRGGHSAAKPYCDGSHAQVGFVAPGTVPGR